MRKLAELKKALDQATILFKEYPSAFNWNKVTEAMSTYQNQWQEELKIRGASPGK